MAQATDSYHDAVTLLRICWRRRWFVAAVTASAVVATYVVLRFKEPVYEATAYLLASGARSSRFVKQPDSLLLSDLLQVTESRSTRTLTTLLESAHLLQEARASLPSELAEAFPNVWHMPVRLENVAGTEVVAIHARSSNKEAAVALADAVAAKGIELSGRINEAATEEGGQSVEAELERTRAKVEGAHERLQAIREEHGVSDLVVETEGMVLQLMELEKLRAESQAKLDATRGDIAQSQEQSARASILVPSASATLGSPVLEGNLAPGNSPSRTRDAASAELEAGPAGPERQAEERTGSATRGNPVFSSVVEALDPAVRAYLVVRISHLRSTEAGLASEVAAYDRAIRSLKQRLQRLYGIKADWDRASDAYAVLQQSYATMLASQEEFEARRKARLEDVRILAAAQLKPYPVAPRPTLDLAAALVLGLLAGGIGAVVSDVYGRRPSRPAGEEPSATAASVAD